MTVIFRTVKSARAFNVVPYWSYRAVRGGGHELLLTQMIMNVVAFIPVGFLLGCAFGRIKWWRVLLTGGAFSILIETLQFVLKRGHTEVDDVVNNVVGWGVYVGMEWLVKHLEKEERR